ncbi:MAG: DUF2851 family protein, partial [Calditrichia bacterium]|nr:DUF2851 family protein [Calditrichia bacterium]
FSHSTFPALNELQLAAEERLLRKHHGFSHLKLTGGCYHYQLYISLWQACGYPHNQAGFTQFAKWLFPFLKKNYTPYNKENIFPLLSYWLKAANLWECFGRLAVYSQFGDKNPQIPKTSNRLFPSSISWNMGKIHPVNHPVLKIWEFIALLSQTCWPNICERIVSAITSRNPASQLLKNLENILILPKTVNGIKHWHTKNRLIEWLMSAALPLSMSYYSFRNEYGMKNYLHELYYTLPAGYNYHKNQFNLEFKYAWQYQGLLEWISKKRGMEGVEKRANS